MTKEELISYYPVPTPFFGPGEITMFVMAGIFIVLGLVIFAFSRNKYVIGVSLTIAAFFVVLSLVMNDVRVSKAPKKYNTFAWRYELFEKKYLPTLEPRRIDVVSIAGWSEDKLNVLLNVETESKRAYSKDIEYYTSDDSSDHGYVLTNYIDDLQEYGVPAGYYGTKIFLPKKSD